MSTTFWLSTSWCKLKATGRHVESFTAHYAYTLIMTSLLLVLTSYAPVAGKYAFVKIVNESSWCKRSTRCCISRSMTKVFTKMSFNHYLFQHSLAHSDQMDAQVQTPLRATFKTVTVLLAKGFRSSTEETFAMTQAVARRREEGDC